MTNQTPESVIAEAMVNAGAPLMHSRVEEGVASALRAANMLREPGAPEAATELTAIKARSEEVNEDEGWHIGGAWGDYGEVVVPLRILSYVVDGALDEKIVSTDPGYAATYAEQVARADHAEAERDAALAAVEVTRKLHHKITRYGNDYYSISAESYEDDPSSYDDLEPFDLCAECYEVERLICEECGGDAPIGHRSSWPCPTVAALDGAPDNESLPNHCQECGAWGTVEVHLRGCSLDGAPEPEVKP